MCAERVMWPRLDILPEPQRQLWSALATMPAEWVLYGGTAIALQLGHRQSIDFDFFANRPLDADRLTAALPFLRSATTTQRAPDTWSVRVDCGGSVAVSFFGVPTLPRLLPPLIAPDTGLRVASLLDLAGLKAAVVQQRAEAKDYLDLDAILATGTIDLPTALAAARALHGDRFAAQSTLKALAFYGDGNLAQVPQAVRDRLAAAVREVDLDAIPTVKTRAP